MIDQKCQVPGYMYQSHEHHWWQLSQVGVRQTCLSQRVSIDLFIVTAIGSTFEDEMQVVADKHGYKTQPTFVLDLLVPPSQLVLIVVQWVVFQPLPFVAHYD